jgi:hypothetical protein
MADQETEVGGIAADSLRSIIERIERLEEERKALANDIKDIFTEAKLAGPLPPSAGHVTQKPRRVTIRPDTCSTLWVIRCDRPCHASLDGEPCMRGPDGHHPPHCYLGAGSTLAHADAMARGYGYEVAL